MRTALLICFLIGIISLTGCMNQVDISAKENQALLLKAQSAIQIEREDLIGTKWYAGRFAEEAGFNRTEKAILKNIEITKFKCKKH